MKIKFQILLSIIFIAAINCSYTDLTDATYDDFIKSNTYVLVKFYAPWCGHCKSMAPAFAEAAQELLSINPQYKLAKLEATENKEVAQKVGIEGYPTLKFYYKGEEKEYTGERTKEGIVTWFKNKVESIELQEANKQEGDIEKDESVFILKDNNFKDFIKNNDYVFVKFYAPWCGHCKRMVPALLKAAKSLEDQGSLVKIAKVDATVEKEVAREVSIRGYPTLKFYYKGEPVDYSGGREAKDIEEWVTKKSVNPSKEVITVEEVEELKKTNDVVVVLFGGNELQSFITFAVSYDHAAFAHTVSHELMDHYKVKEGGVVLFKNFDEKRNDLPKVYNVATIRTFVETRTIPSLMTYEKKFDRLIFGTTPVIAVFYKFEGSNADPIDDALFDLSKKIRGRYLLVRSDNTTEEQKKFCEDLGVTENIFPAVLILHNTENTSKKYIMDKNRKLNSNSIRKFVNEFQNKTAQVFIKSEEVPEAQPGPVVQLVGKNFDQIVKDPTKDVLVEFYAPWCGHCKKIAPTWDQLGLAVEETKTLVIAKIDATANETDIAVSGYPTIKLFPANNKSNPIDYKRNGTDTVDDFIKFIKENASHKLVAGLDDFEDEEDEVKKDL